MTDDERQKLEARYWELERILQEIFAGKVVEGDPAELEGTYLAEQDEIEGLLGEDYFERREGPDSPPPGTRS